MTASSFQKPVHVPLEAKDWQVSGGWKRLDDLCQGVFDCPHTTPIVTKSGPYVVRSQDIRSGIFLLSEAGHVSDATYQDRIARAEPRHGDLLYSREGTYFGIAAEVPPDIQVCLGQRMVLIRPASHLLNARFLRYWLNSPIMARYIEGFRDGSVAERLNMPVIRGLPVPAFDYEVQVDIAELLGALDDKIELNRRMNETLEAMARAMFKDWFVDFGPVRAKLEGRAPYLAPDIWSLFPDRLDDEGKPEGWQNATFGEHAFNFDSKRIPVSGGERAKRQGPYPYHGATGVMDHVDNYIFDGVYLLIGEDGSVVRDSGLAFTQYVWGKIWVNNHAHVLQGKGAVSTEQLLLYFHHEPVGPYITGAVQLKLSQGRMNSMPMVYAGEKICREFSEVVAPLFARFRHCAEEDKTLAALRDLLLPKLMSGEIRVRDAEKLVGQAA